MPRNTIQAIERSPVVNRIERAVFVVCKCARRVRGALVFNVDYIDWRICDFTYLLMFWEVYVNLAKVVRGDVERTAGVSVHDSFGLHLGMFLGYDLLKNYLY